ncbi:PAH2 domain-containing protein, partial [Ramicandelaber brevisporus]
MQGQFYGQQHQAPPPPPPAAVQASQRSPSPAPNQQGGGVHDALSYLDVVRQCFAQDQTTYGRFLEIMGDFRQQNITTEVVIARVANVFRGRPELIEGFNTFLPEGYQVYPEYDQHQQQQALPVTPSAANAVRTTSAASIGGPQAAQTPAAPTTTPAAINYVNRIKDRFRHQPDVYQRFLDILQSFQRESRPIDEV